MDPNLLILKQSRPAVADDRVDTKRAGFRRDVSGHGKARRRPNELCVTER